MSGAANPASFAGENGDSRAPGDEQVCHRVCIDICRCDRPGSPDANEVAGREEAAGTVIEENSHDVRAHAADRNIGPSVAVEVGCGYVVRTGTGGVADKPGKTAEAVAPENRDPATAFVRYDDVDESFPVEIDDGDGGRARPRREPASHREGASAVAERNPNLLTHVRGGEKVEVAVAVHVRATDGDGTERRVLGYRELEASGTVAQEDVDRPGGDEPGHVGRCDVGIAVVVEVVHDDVDGRVAEGEALDVGEVARSVT